MLPPTLPSRTGDLRLTRKKRSHPASKSFPVRLQPDISLIMTVFSKSDICYQILIERLLRGDGLCGAWTHHCPHPFRPLKGVQPSVVHILYATISSLGNVPGNEGRLPPEHDREGPQPPPLVMGVPCNQLSPPVPVTHPGAEEPPVDVDPPLPAGAADCCACLTAHAPVAQPRWIWGKGAWHRGVSPPGTRTMLTALPPRSLES